MKKSFLLMALACSALAANAQNARQAMLGTNVQGNANSANFHTSNVSTPVFTESRGGNTSMARTTTVGGSRWLSYVGYQSQIASMSSSFPYLWFRCNSKDAFGATPPATGIEYDSNKSTTMGFILDPYIDGFKDPAGYPGQIDIRSGIDAFTVDSVMIYGAYGRNPAKTGVVDTMRFSFFYGDGTTSSNIFGNQYFTGMASRYGSDTVRILNCLHDSLSNHAAQNTGGTSIVVIDVPLTTNTVNDTTANGVVYVVATKTGGILSVPAGHNFVGMTLSFKTGDASFVAGDTVFKSDGTTGSYKYNMFRPQVAYYGSSTTPTWAPYTDWHVNGNTGLFKYQPDGGWFGNYVPQWAWSSNNGTSAATFQIPVVDFKVSCSTCWSVDVPKVPNVISSAKAYPVPAVSEVNVPFTLSQNANVTVTLTNSIGQVVGTQNMTNVTSGKATFNVASLAAGVYMYSVEANGQRSVGRVVVAH